MLSTLTCGIQLTRQWAQHQSSACPVFLTHSRGVESFSQHEGAGKERVSFPSLLRGWLPRLQGLSTGKRVVSFLSSLAEICSCMKSTKAIS